jgi:hypothetical protein
MPEPVAYTPEGQPIADEQLHQAIQSGDARFKTGQRVHFVDTEGSHYSVPGEQAWEHIARGAKPLTTGEAEHYQALKAAEESKLSTAQAAAHGLAKGLTLGAVDPLLASIDPTYAKRVQINEEAHPTAEGAAELASYALPIAGELGLGGKAVKAATAIPRGLSGAARAVGGSIENKIGRMAVEGAIEGAGYGVGNQLSESAIHNEPLTAQSVLMSAAEGGGLGLALGGALGGFSKLAERRAGAVAKALPEAGAAERATLKDVAAGTAETAEKPASMGQRLQSVIHDTASEGATGQAWKTVGATGADIARIEAKEVGGKAASSRMANRITEEAGIAPFDSAHTVAEKVGEMKRQTGQIYEGIQDQLNEQGIKLNAQRAIESVEENVLAPMRSSATNAERKLAASIDHDYVDRFRKIVSGKDEKYAVKLEEEMGLVSIEREGEIRRSLAENGIEPTDRQVRRTLRAQEDSIREQAAKNLEPWRLENAKPDVGFNELRKLRGSIDKAIDNEKAKINARPDQLSAKQIALKNLRNDIQNSITKQLTEISPELGKTFTDANRSMRDWIAIDKIATRRAAMESGHRAIGLLGSIHTTTGAIIGGGPGAAIGLAAGVLAKRPGASLLASKAFKKLSEFSSLGTADAIKEAAQASGRMAQSAEKSAAAHSLAAPKLSEAAAYMVPVALARGAATVAEIAQHAQTATQSPEYQQHTQLASLDSAPGLQNEVIATQAAALKTVADMAPHAMQPPNPALGDNQPPPDEASSKEFARAVELIEAGNRHLDTGLQNNSITRADVALMQKVFPDAFKGFQGAVMKATLGQVKQGKMPSYQRRLQVGIITGMPMDNTDTPEFSQTIQAYYDSTGASSPQGGAAPPSPTRRAPELASRQASFSESLMDRT